MHVCEDDQERPHAPHQRPPSGHSCERVRALARIYVEGATTLLPAYSGATLRHISPGTAECLKVQKSAKKFGGLLRNAYLCGRKLNPIHKQK